MGSRWRWRRLGELTDNFDSTRVPVKEPDRRSGPYPYYGASGVVDHVDKFLYDGEYLLIAEDGENLRTRTTPVAFLARGRFWVNNHAHVVRGNTQADTRFLMYALAAVDISGYLSGSAMPKLTQASLNRIPLLVPEVAEQRRIADILSALDNKIELNRRISQTLESMARALFKSWFIDFDPVRARLEGEETGLPELLDGQFPDSFEPLDPGVPRGWGRQTVEGACDLVIRGVTPAYEAGSGRYVINQRVNRGPQLDWTALKELSSSLDVPSDRYAHKWDVLVNCLGEGTLGRVHLFKGPSHRYAIDQHMAICRASDPSATVYLYQVLASEPGQEKIESLKTGSTGMTMLNVSRLRVFDFLWPGDVLVHRYFDMVQPLWNAVACTEVQGGTLTELRSALLPALMSGEYQLRASHVD